MRFNKPVFFGTWAGMMLVIIAAALVVDYDDLGKPAPQAVFRSSAVTDSIPSLLQVTGWLAQYGFDVVPADDAPVWESEYPDSGSTIARFIWRVETIVPAAGIPPEEAAGVFTKLRILTRPEHRDSIRVSVAGIDSAGNTGSWSPVGTWE